MTLTLHIRRDADGSTEEVRAEATAAGSAINVHPHEAFTLSERDILILDAEELTVLLTE